MVALISGYRRKIVSQIWLNGRQTDDDSGRASGGSSSLEAEFLRSAQVAKLVLFGIPMLTVIKLGVYSIQSQRVRVSEWERSLAA